MIETIELNKALIGYKQAVVIPFLRHWVRLHNFRPPPRFPSECGSVLTKTLRDHYPFLRHVLTSNQDHDYVVGFVVNGSRALAERYYGSVGSDLAGFGHVIGRIGSSHPHHQV